MFTNRNDDSSDFEADPTPTGPVRQRRSFRLNAAKRSRITSRRKTRVAGNKNAKVGGIHQRANKRVSW